MKEISTGVLNALEPGAHTESVESVPVRQPNVPLFFLGTLLILIGLTIYFLGIVFSIFRLTFHLSMPYRAWNQAITWYSGVPTTLGVLLAAADLALLLQWRVVAELHQRHLVRLLLIGRHKSGPARAVLIGVEAEQVLVPLL